MGKLAAHYRAAIHVTDRRWTLTYFFLLKWHFTKDMMCFLCPEISTHWSFFTNVIMCFCATGDRFCVCSHFDLNHLFATKAHLGRAGRSKAGGNKVLSVFLVMQLRNYCILLQIGRGESKLGHHQLLFQLAMSCAHGKYLVSSVLQEHQRWGLAHSQAVT